MTMAIGERRKGRKKKQGQKGGRRCGTLLLGNNLNKVKKVTARGSRFFWRFTFFYQKTESEKKISKKIWIKTGFKKLVKKNAFKIVVILIKTIPNLIKIIF